LAAKPIGAWLGTSFSRVFQSSAGLAASSAPVENVAT
jgi:hypothetical protein